MIVAEAVDPVLVEKELGQQEGAVDERSIVEKRSFASEVFPASEVDMTGPFGTTQTVEGGSYPHLKRKFSWLFTKEESS